MLRENNDEGEDAFVFKYLLVRTPVLCDTYIIAIRMYNKRVLNVLVFHGFAANSPIVRGLPEGSFIGKSNHFCDKKHI